MFKSGKSKKSPSCDCPPGRHALSFTQIMGGVDNLLREVDDPGNPRCCAACLEQWVTDFGNCETAVDEVKKGKHQFFAAAMAVLYALHGRPIRPVREQLAVIETSCPNRIRHGRHIVPGVVVYERFIQYILLCVCSGLVLGSRLLDDYPYFSKKAHWPTSIEQLFPFGFERGVDVMVYWCCAGSPEEAFLLLAKCTSAALDSIVPLITTDPQRVRLLRAMMHRFSTIPVDWPPAIPLPFPRPDGIRFLYNQNGKPGLVNNMLSIIQSVSSTRSDVLDRFVSGLERPLLASIEMIPPRRPGEPPVHMDLPSFAAYLRARIGQASLPPDTRSTVQLVYEYVQANETRGKKCCSNPACRARQLAAGVERHFPLCSRCTFVQYCDRQCQRTDWASHRLVCASLMKLEHNLGNHDGSEKALRQAWEACDFDPMDVGRIRSWVLGSGMVPAASIGSGYRHG